MVEPVHPRVAAWLESRDASFRAGRVHEENLAYLLADEYVPGHGWQLARSVFESVVEALSPGEEHLVLRAIVPLHEHHELVLGPIAASAIDGELDLHSPPKIALFPAILGFGDRRPFETYTVMLDDVASSGVVTYGAYRDRQFDPDGPWQRYVELEHAEVRTAR